mmetsp:Transcript_20092/g.36336  ORF Transcript_20092/g.36336 Transcript_20092/m.36336 type:complete len:220 (-) Transcript_20092:330-989(-)
MWPGSPRHRPTPKPPAPRAAKQTPLAVLPSNRVDPSSAASGVSSGSKVPATNATLETANQNAGICTGSRKGLPAAAFVAGAIPPELVRARIPDVSCAAKPMDSNQLPPKKASNAATSVLPPGRWIVGNMTCTGHRNTGSHRLMNPTLGISKACNLSAAGLLISAAALKALKDASMPPIWVGKYSERPVCSIAVFTPASKARKPPMPVAIPAAAVADARY